MDILELRAQKHVSMKKLESHCFFCGKGRKEVKYLVMGIEASICDGCVELARDLLGEKRCNEVKKG